MPSLLELQQMRAQHGPSLPMDQQLHWILEPQIFHLASYLRAHRDLLCRDYDVICLARVHPVVFRCLLFLHEGKRPVKADLKHRDSSGLHAEWNHRHFDDHVPQIPHQTCPLQQDYDWKLGDEGSAILESVWHFCRQKLGSDLWRKQVVMAVPRVLRLW